MKPQTLQELSNQPEHEIDLALASLTLARELDYPDLLPATGMAQLDHLAAELAPRLPAGATRERLLALARLLFEEYRFKGNDVDYYDPRNSYLNEVLARRLGIPITLSLVLLEVGQRAGLALYGVGLPGHFLVAAQLENGERIYVDPYNAGRVVDTAAMVELAQQAFDAPVAFETAWLQPVRPREFLVRMCNNLQGAYLRMGDWPRAVLATERLFWLSSDADVLRDLGFLYFQAGQLGQAAAAFENYLLAAPEAEDAEAVQASLMAVYQRLTLLN